MKRKDVVRRAIDEIDRRWPVGTTSRTNKRDHIEEVYAQEPILENLIENSLELYSRTACLQLCETLIGKLPRELKDLVAEFLITPDIVYAGPQYLTNEGRPCENDRDAHFWDKDYVGETLSLELIQNWYRLSLFYFWDKSSNDEVIERFMVLDRWGRGIKPNEHIARVRLDLGDGKLHNPYWLGGPNHNGKPHCDLGGFSSRLVAPLKTLSLIRMPNRIRFLIRVHTLGGLEFGCLNDEHLHETLEELLAELRALRLLGHRFTLQWSEVGNLEFTSSDSTLTADAWKKEIAEVRCLHCMICTLYVLTTTGYSEHSPKIAKLTKVNDAGLRGKLR
jgi:hypothetical protein